MPKEYLPIRPIEVKGTRIYLDHTTEVDFFEKLDLEKIVDSCKVKPAILVDSKERAYPRHEQGFEDWIGTVVRIKFDNNGEQEITLGPNAKYLKEDLDIKENSKLINLKINFYELPNGDPLGLSINR